MANSVFQRPHQTISYEYLLDLLSFISYVLPVQHKMNIEYLTLTKHNLFVLQCLFDLQTTII